MRKYFLFIIITPCIMTNESYIIAMTRRWCPDRVRAKRRSETREEATMTQDEYDAVLRRVDTALTGIDGTLRQMKQQLDRTDATHAGISTTLAGIRTTLERFATTLDRWMERQANGH